MLRIGPRVLAAALSALCFASGAEAGFLSGMDLLAICAPARADPGYRLKLAECRGYVIGVADTFDCRNQLLGFHLQTNTQVQQRDLVDVVLARLRRNPQYLGYKADGLVAAALSETFPCR